MPHVRVSVPDPCADSNEDRVRRVANRLAGAGADCQADFRIVDEIDGAPLQAKADDKERAVLVTRALAERLTDDELAWVVAHELAHFERDDRERMKAYARRRANEGVNAVRTCDEHLKAKGYGFVTRFVADIAATVVQGVDGYLDTADEAKRVESQADRRAFELATAAGYDPNGAAGALRKVHGGLRSSTGFVRSLAAGHPDPTSRVRALEKHVAEKRRR